MVDQRVDAPGGSVPPSAGFTGIVCGAALLAHLTDGTTSESWIDGNVNELVKDQCRFAKSEIFDRQRFS